MKEALSLSKQLRKHIEQVKANYSRVSYYEKHFKIVSYIELFGIFTVNTILTEMREDKISITHRTVSKYCQYLMIDKFLSFLTVPTRFKIKCQIFWLDTVSSDEVIRMIDYYVQINKKLKNAKSKNSSGNKKLYQKTLDAHTIQALAHRNGRKIMNEVKKEQIEIEDLPGLILNKLQLTPEEHEKIYGLPPAGQKYFKSGYVDITKMYYKDRKNLSELVAFDLFQERKENLIKTLTNQKYMEF